nr:MAG TPA: hypothetical protein [Caudoviricetes sp.]
MNPKKKWSVLPLHGRHLFTLRYQQAPIYKRPWPFWDILPSHFYGCTCKIRVYTAYRLWT